MAIIDEKGNELIRLAKDVSKYCNNLSCKSCENGRCKFSSIKSRCIFKDAGMGFPFEWFNKEAT